MPEEKGMENILKEVQEISLKEVSLLQSSENVTQELPVGCCVGCKCVHFGQPPVPAEEVEILLKLKEEELADKFQKELHNNIAELKKRAEFILQNEQVRASYMLREAHRERQEKIKALQTQLACKNLAGLMYVMCTERKRSKAEKMAIIEEYSNYIFALQEILAEAQNLILKLSRGYKTAARVDQEWRDKMKKTLAEFQMFINDFTKGTPELNQYFLDLPKLLKTESPIIDNSEEDPCNCEEDNIQEEEIVAKVLKPWYERMDEEYRPFVVFGDMADFTPPRRRETLRAVKKIKSAPKKWKEYVFHDTYLNAECNNASAIKDEYLKRMPTQRWDATELVSRQSTQLGSPTGRRTPAHSVDVRGGGGMGSILKMITSTNGGGVSYNKTLLLGARDSMEIASSTKLRVKQHRQSENNNVVINVGARRTSLFPNGDDDDDESQQDKPTYEPSVSKDVSTLDEKIEESSASVLGSIHHDSLTVLPSRRRPERDHIIHYEKVCPMEKCKRLQVNSFIRSLPAYMKASPFDHMDQTFEDYEVCSAEQLEILKQRIEAKKKREKADKRKPGENPLQEWQMKSDGVAVQTSDQDCFKCPCMAPTPTPNESRGQIFNVADLLPFKKILNQIKQECFYDEDIEFNRFQVVGLDTDKIQNRKENNNKPNCNKLHEVKKILAEHPSLLDMFQANTA